MTGWSEPLRYTSYSLSFNSTPRCFAHFDLLGIHFLACCVSIWKRFWHDLYSHFPMLLRWWGGFLSLWPNKSDSCQREKAEKWDLKFPWNSLSCGAQLQCILFSIHMVQLQSWELQVERRAKTRQKWLIFIGTELPVVLVITVLVVEFESKGKSRWAYFNRVFSILQCYFYRISKFLYSKTLNAQSTPKALSQHRLYNSNLHILTERISYFITHVAPRIKRVLLKLLETVRKETLCSR